MSVPTRPSSVRPVALSALAEVAGLASPATDVDVTGVCLRSGSVVAGDLFAALPGARTHGAAFAAQARAAGAVAVLTDPDGVGHATAAGLPTLVAADPRSLLGTLAATVYGHPATALSLVGVTGTQGKTTTTQLLSAGLAAAGRRTAVIGTMGTWVDGEQVKTPLTTPEAPDLHAMFAVMRERGVDVCAMEVSSHALVLGRVDGVMFDVAVFLNFGRDHLDFHGDVEHYLAAKASLFTPERARRALLNADDRVVAGLLERLEIPVHTFSPAGGTADWRCVDLALRPDGSDFTVEGPGGLRTRVSTNLPGDFNAANVLAGLAAAGEAGYDVPAVAAGMAEITSVAGRLERVDAGQAFAVVVDYAHKPDAVSAVLRALRAVTAGRLWIVLGAGGDRDHGKRALMGRAAADIADVLVVTDDNPRGEDPAVIRAAIIEGAREALTSPSRRGRVEIHEVAGRQAAIERALVGAADADTVLIAGKGHETGQEVGDRVIAFDDRAVARDILTGLTGVGSTR